MDLIQYSNIAQAIVAASVVFVWVMQLDIIIEEFALYRLSPLIRNAVGALKIALSTLLIAGIWYPNLVLYPALLMAFLMLCAQIAHFTVRHPIRKYLPSLALLILSLFIAAVRGGWLPK